MRAFLQISNQLHRTYPEPLPAYCIFGALEAVVTHPTCPQQNTKKEGGWSDILVSLQFQPIHHTSVPLGSYNIISNMKICEEKKHALHCTAPSLPSHEAGVCVPAVEDTQNEAIPEPQLHPLVEFSADPKVQNMEAVCNGCHSKVTGNEVLGHLFFGDLKCRNCLFIINDCQIFKKAYPPKEKCSKTGGHHVMTRWEQSVWDYLWYCARRSIKMTNPQNEPQLPEIKCIIMSYLKALNPLKDMNPWKSAYEDAEVKRHIEFHTSAWEPQQELINNDNKNTPPSSYTNANSKQIHIGNQSNTKNFITDIPNNAAPSEADKLGQRKFRIDKSVEKDEKAPAVMCSVTQTSQSSKPGNPNIQQKEANDTGEKNTLLTAAGEMNQNSKLLRSSAPCATQKSYPLVRKVKKEKPNHQSREQNTSTAQIIKKFSSPKLKKQEERPNQQIIALVKKASQITKKSSSQERKRNLSEQRSSQQSKTVRITKKSTPQKRKSNEQRPNKQSKVARITKKSTPQKRKSSEQRPNKQNKVARITKKSTPQKRKSIEQRPNQQSKVSQITKKFSLQKGKMRRETPNQQSAVPKDTKRQRGKPAAQTPLKSTPQRTKVKQSRTKHIGQGSTPLIGSAAQTLETSKVLEKDLPPVGNELNLKQKEKLKYSDFIPKKVLDSKHYLVISPDDMHEYLENCPNCYSHVSLSHCVVNISLIIPEFICSECNLSIFVVQE